MSNLRFFIDTNQINARQKSYEMNLLEEWKNQELIEIFLPQIAYIEVKNNNSQLLKTKADAYIYTITEEDESLDIDPLRKKIFELMEINSQSTINDINDAKIVHDASRMCAVLITADGGSKSQSKGILGRRHILEPYVTIVNPTEAVQMVRSKLKL